MRSKISMKMMKRSGESAFPWPMHLVNLGPGEPLSRMRVEAVERVVDSMPATPSIIETLAP